MSKKDNKIKNIKIETLKIAYMWRKSINRKTVTSATTSKSYCKNCSYSTNSEIKYKHGL